jgi:hypothetical protein
MLRVLSVAVLASCSIVAQVNPLDTRWPSVTPTTWLSGQPETDVDVALDRSGSGVLVWRQRTAAPPWTTYELWARRLYQGSPQGPEIRLAGVTDYVTGSSESLYTRCAVDEEGSWVVVWNTTNTVAGNLEVRARWWHEPSQTLGPERLVTDDPGAQMRFLPDVAMGPAQSDTNPSFWVVWQEGFFAGQSSIRMRRYRITPSGGTAIDTADPILDVNAEPTAPIEGQEQPAVAVAADGTVTVVWTKWADWGGASPYWRIMMRQRRGGNWIGIYDPSATGAGSSGVDFTDYEVSPPNEWVAAINDQDSPPRVAAAPDGRVVVMWKRYNPVPFGLRTFSPGSATVPSPALLHQPTIPSAGYRRFDLAFSNEGSVSLLWEQMDAALVSGRIVYSRLNATSGVAESQTLIDTQSTTDVRRVAIAASDTGSIVAAWARGFPNAQRIHIRRADLNLLASDPLGDLRIAVPGAPGLRYLVWPLAMPTSFATPIGDGRTILLSLADPLLQWHLAQGGNHAILPNASGILSPSGTTTVAVNLPPGIGSLNLGWALGIVDPTAPWPRTLRLFTQPELIVVN